MIQFLDNHMDIAVSKSENEPSSRQLTPGTGVEALTTQTNPDNPILHRGHPLAVQLAIRGFIVALAANASFS